MPSHLEAIERGNTIGRWSVKRKLGEGSMGMVFEAATANGRSAALKVLRPELLASPRHRARFEREAKLLQKVIHPNVVRLFETGESGGFIFLALELLEGDSLSQRIRKMPFSAPELVKLATELLSGLLAVHEQGVLHRDVKPANVLMGSDGRWKLADFGLGREQTPEVENAQLTHVGTPIGTAPYMSPEVCQGFAATERSDLD